MSINKVLQKGSYNGVNFLFSSNSQKSGRKIVNFEYPESDIRTSQDLGKFLPIYDLTITVTGTEDTYLQNRAALINALDTPAEQFLLRNNQSTNMVHPLDGNIRVTAGEYTITEDINNLGVSKFRVKFYAIREVNYPTETASNASNIDNIFNEILNDIRKGFEGVWQVLIDLENDLNKASQYIFDISSLFKGVIGLVNVLPNAISNFIDQVKNLENSTLALAQLPKDLATNVDNLFAQIQNLTSTTSNKTILNKQFFNTNVGIQYELNTQARINSEKNRKSINTYVNSLSFSYEAYNTSVAEYTNTDDINAQIDSLSKQHKFIIDNNFYIDNEENSNDILNEDVIDQITKLFDYTVGYLQEQKASSKNVKNINVINNNLVAITYAYYDTLSEYDTINLLNDVGDPTQIQGNFKVLI